MDRISGLGAGRHAERIAANVLALRGYRILEWNRRESRDEIDLIAERDGWTVFVEVKFRRTTAFGGPILAVDGVKRRRLLRGARAYLQRSGRAGRPARFDVIAILWSESEGRLTVDHLENAFAPSRWG